MAARRRQEQQDVLQALNAINPTLHTQNVDLMESAQRQTSAAQSFLLDSKQRYLSFTVDGLNSLSLNGSGLSDTFEVALLNANTYAQLNGAENSPCL